MILIRRDWGIDVGLMTKKVCKTTALYLHVNSPRTSAMWRFHWAQTESSRLTALVPYLTD